MAYFFNANDFVNQLKQDKDYLLAINKQTGAGLIYVFRHGVYEYMTKIQVLGWIKDKLQKEGSELVRTKIINEIYFLMMMASDADPAVEELNADENLINFRNGILNLTTLKLQAHSKDILSTIQLPFDWPENDVCDTPVFDKYLNTLSNGNDEIARFLLTWIGLTISNVPVFRTKRSLWLVGPGNTGKSLFRKLLEKMLGSENYRGIDLRDLEGRFGAFALYGKRLAGSPEASSLELSELNVFKSVVAGDSISAERKGETNIEFVYKGAFITCSNQLPYFRGDTGRWLFERICIVNCDNVVSEEQRDPYLIERFAPELPGIAKKSLLLLKELIANDYKFKEPSRVIDARMAYEIANNSVKAFAQYAIVLKTDPNAEKENVYTIRDVYATYKDFCLCKKYSVYSSAEFKSELSAALGVPVSDLTYRSSSGIVLKNHTLSKNVTGCCY